MDYTKICFVIMPFGKKKVGEREVDFDRIYDQIFAPAVAATPLPEGGNLEPRRTDKDFFAGSISQEMFCYIEYSRFALADISGLNANVFYELGARHRAQESGTAIFRQTEAPIPFDINQIKAFPYEYEPEETVGKSRELIRQILTESLLQNRLDSPVQLALRAQRRHQQDIEGLLREAEDALRLQDRGTCVAKYQQAIEAQSDNPLLRMKLGLLIKDHGGPWEEALGHFLTAIRLDPRYSEAWRERGIAENKIYNKKKEGPTGEESLARAVELNPQDFDALASLGGVLKRLGRLEEARQRYHQATEVSRGHTYPLLNELKLEAKLAGKLEIDGKRRFQLSRGESSLRAQVANVPPYNAPWSFFDLAEIRLYLGAKDQFLKTIDDGLLLAQKWQAETFRDSLKLLTEAGVHLDGLPEGIQKVEEIIQYMD